MEEITMPRKASHRGILIFETATSKTIHFCPTYLFSERELKRIYAGKDKLKFPIPISSRSIKRLKAARALGMTELIEPLAGEVATGAFWLGVQFALSYTASHKRRRKGTRRHSAFHLRLVP